jgi:flagellar biogenesis protein FliO
VPLSFWLSYVAKLAILALLLGALYFLVAFLQRRQLLGRRRRCLSLIEAIPLTQHSMLYVVRIGTRHFLIAAGAGSVSMLAELAPSDLPATR